MTDEDVEMANTVLEANSDRVDFWPPASALRRVLEDFASRHGGVTEGALRPPREAEHGESPPSSRHTPAFTQEDVRWLRHFAENVASPRAAQLRDLANRIAASIEQQGAEK